MTGQLWEGAYVAIPTSLNECRHTGSLGLQVKDGVNAMLPGMHHLALTPLLKVLATLLWLPLEDLVWARQASIQDFAMPICRFCNANL